VLRYWGRLGHPPGHNEKVRKKFKKKMYFNKTKERSAYILYTIPHRTTKCVNTSAYNDKITMLEL
jgi:hypothetical protein